MRITAPQSVAALTRAFTPLLRFGGEPVAVPIAKAEAQGFPRWSDAFALDGVTWLAVGMDRQGRASYALQTASSPFNPFAHEAARERALRNLAQVCATAGFPMGEARGKGVKPRPAPGISLRYKRGRTGVFRTTSPKRPGCGNIRPLLNASTTHLAQRHERPCRELARPKELYARPFRGFRYARVREKKL